MGCCWFSLERNSFSSKSNECFVTISWKGFVSLRCALRLLSPNGSETESLVYCCFLTHLLLLMPSTVFWPLSLNTSVAATHRGTRTHNRRVCQSLEDLQSLVLRYNRRLLPNHTSEITSPCVPCSSPFVWIQNVSHICHENERSLNAPTQQVKFRLVSYWTDYIEYLAVAPIHMCYCNDHQSTLWALCVNFWINSISFEH